MRRFGIPVFSVTCIVILTAVLVGAEPDSSARGREIYEKRCTGCHTLDNVKAGPPLRGVFGRRAASDPQFPYSDALKKSKISWDESTLDRWLTDPDQLVPDNDMSFRMDNAAERAALIAYLKKLSAERAGTR